jgi:hypothetical protein
VTLFEHRWNRRPPRALGGRALAAFHGSPGPGTKYAYKSPERVSEGEMAYARPVHRVPTTARRLPNHRGDDIVHTTLLELVRTIGEITDDEAEIVATVIHMLRSGQVELAGSFRGEPIRKLLD